MKMLIALLLVATNNYNNKIEDLFWDCDYLSNTKLLNFTEAEYCGKIFETVKKEKFNDSWQDFYDWWLKNKTAEYKKRHEMTIKKI